MPFPPEPCHPEERKENARSSCDYHEEESPSDSARVHGISKEEFNRYRAVQYGGQFNMIVDAARAQRAAGLSKARYMACIEHYGELEDAFGEYQE